MSQLRTAIGAGDHVLGSTSAPITMVEYGDYECPFCGRAQPEVRRVQQALGEELCFVYRHFPLSQVHPHASQAAEAAESAGAQGRFWEMHELLFENQDALDPQALLAYAHALGLDLDRFTKDLDTHRFLQRVRRDFMSGARSGVNGTPTFFINGYRHDGAFTADALLEALRGGPSAYPF